MATFSLEEDARKAVPRTPTRSSVSPTRALLVTVSSSKDQDGQVWTWGYNSNGQLGGLTATGSQRLYADRVMTKAGEAEIPAVPEIPEVPPVIDDITIESV